MKLLFVCSGNICRSPMAERLAERAGDRLGVTVEARSAGILGIVGKPADRHAVAVCRQLGLDLSDHRSQGMSEELIAWADRILVMEYAHAAHLREFYPSVGDKILVLGTFIGRPEIGDPLGGWRWTFRRVRNDLDRAIQAFLRRVTRR